MVNVNRFFGKWCAPRRNGQGACQGKALFLVAQYKQLTGIYTFDYLELSRLVLTPAIQMWLFIAFAVISITCKGGNEATDIADYRGFGRRHPLLAFFNHIIALTMVPFRKTLDRVEAEIKAVA